MNTDERGYFDDAMTERVLGAIFEVSNTLGAGTPTPENRFSDGSNFRDPMRGKGQSAAPSGLPEVQVPGGTISGGNCNNPRVLTPGAYFAVGPQPGCKGAGCPTVATGQPIRVTGCVVFSSGAGNFGNYVLFGGAHFDSPGTVVTFDPGRFIFAGALAGNHVFSQTNGVTLQDRTPLSAAGVSMPNTDAGEIFILTDDSYPGLQVPVMVQNIASQLQFGSVDIQMGNNPSSLMNLHGLNPNSPHLPASLKTFAPTIVWQDQRNSHVLHTPSGQIDTASCGPGRSTNNPCPNTSPGISPNFQMQAHPNLHLYGVFYQPRGASLTLQGNGNLSAPMRLITGALSLNGGPNITLQPAPNLTRKVVALVE